MLQTMLALFMPPAPPRRKARERFLLPMEWHRVKAVLDTCPSKVRIFFYTLLLEGPRPTEARTMQWTHVDLVAGLWYKPKTKSGRIQVLPLSQACCLLLNELPRLGRYMFTGDPSNSQSRENRPWSRSAVKYWWQFIRKEADLPDVQIRDLRRTCASWLTIYGENLLVTKDVLHHSSVATTQIYARLDQATVRSALTRHAARIFA